MALTEAQEAAVANATERPKPEGNISFPCACGTCMHKLGVTDEGVNTLVFCGFHRRHTHASERRSSCPDHHPTP